MMTASSDPARLRVLAEQAARGQFPPATWQVDLLPAPPRLLGAVVAYTGHHAIAADLGPATVEAALDPTDIAAPFNPTFLTWLARQASAGHVDVVLARSGTGRRDEMLAAVSDPPDNERVRRAARQRTDVVYLADTSRTVIVTLGAGLRRTTRDFDRDLRGAAPRRHRPGRIAGRARTRPARGLRVRQRRGRQHPIAALFPGHRVRADRCRVPVH